MKLPATFLAALEATDGAGSHVTSRERHDKQLTLDDDEKAVVINLLGSSIYRGAVNSDRDRSFHSIPLYFGTTYKDTVPMAIVHPKSTGDETRLYFRSQGFNPNANDHWYAFKRKDGKLAIGFCSQKDFLRISSKFPIGDGPEEENDDAFVEQVQQSLQGKPSKKVSSKGGGYYRDPAITDRALRLAHFTCAIDASHITFVSRSTGYPFVEAHHIIPMSASVILPSKILDRVENIAALCPNCHRRIHYGTSSDQTTLVELLLSGKESLLADLELSKDQVVSFYVSLAALKAEKSATALS